MAATSDNSASVSSSLPETIPVIAGVPRPAGDPLPLILQDAVRRLLDDMHGNEVAAARALGVKVQTLRAWLE